jgi:hypothetical protein
MLSEYTNRVWELQTWYVSVTMALFTFAYFVARKLNFLQILFVVVTYTLYCNTILRNLTRVYPNIVAARSDLETMVQEGVAQSQLSQRLLVSYPDVGPWSLAAAQEMGFLFLLFLGALGYLYSQYQEGKKQIYSEKKS